MGFIDSLINSLRLPKKEAMFRLNRKGMTNTIVYLFMLLAILFLPDMIRTIKNLDTNLTEVSRGQYLVQVMVFYPLFIIFLILIGVSILAGGALLLRKVLGRKMTYQQLWKLTAYAATLPLILSVVLKNIAIPDGVSALLFFAIFSLLMYRMITIYPKKPTKRLS
ncbi:DUF1189 family protein [Halobacillus sp. BBL2006]|uniref:DUF1189 family protein n=1 Tax=Halobacillus sp. BBL2006 TaxID=1543706 RepID=UPI000541CC45|nr:DUF1189 family protein [Halobacillus sp. BBL2006]KHE67229.1 hypothetical protein LD39_18620 [Halobacillus sp. BBL2006]